MSHSHPSGRPSDRLELADVALKIDSSNDPALEFARDQDADAAIADARPMVVISVFSMLPT